MNEDVVIRNLRLYILSDIEMDETLTHNYKYIRTVFNDLNMYKYDDLIFYGKSKTDLRIAAHKDRDDRIWISRNIDEDIYENTFSYLGFHPKCCLIKFVVENYMNTPYINEITKMFSSVNLNSLEYLKGNLDKLI